MSEEKTKEKSVELTEVVTQTQNAFKLPNEEVVSLEQYLVWIGNEIIKIKKTIGVQ